eukprot:1511774-Rhodomonas_salina.1
MAGIPQKENKAGKISSAQRKIFFENGFSFALSFEEDVQIYVIFQDIFKICAENGFNTGQRNPALLVSPLSPTRLIAALAPQSTRSGLERLFYRCVRREQLGLFRVDLPRTVHCLETQPVANMACRHQIRNNPRSRRRMARVVAWTSFVAVFMCFFLPQSVCAKKEAAADESVVEGEAQFPMVADDTRFFNNFTAERTGPPVKIRLQNADQYSRIFYSPREGAIASELIEEIEAGEEVLDIGAETGVFSLTVSLPPSLLSDRGRERAREWRRGCGLTEAGRRAGSAEGGVGDSDRVRPCALRKPLRVCGAQRRQGLCPPTQGGGRRGECSERVDVCVCACVCAPLCVSLCVSLSRCICLSLSLSVALSRSVPMECVCARARVRMSAMRGAGVLLPAGAGADVAGRSGC